MYDVPQTWFMYDVPKTWSPFTLPTMWLHLPKMRNEPQSISNNSNLPKTFPFDMKWILNNISQIHSPLVWSPKNAKLHYIRCAWKMIYVRCAWNMIPLTLPTMWPHPPKNAKWIPKHFQSKVNPNASHSYYLPKMRNKSQYISTHSPLVWSSKKCEIALHTMCLKCDLCTMCLKHDPPHITYDVTSSPKNAKWILKHFRSIVNPNASPIIPLVLSSKNAK